MPSDWWKWGSVSGNGLPEAGLTLCSLPVLLPSPASFQGWDLPISPSSGPGCKGLTAWLGPKELHKALLCFRLHSPGSTDLPSLTASSSPHVQTPKLWPKSFFFQIVFVRKKTHSDPLKAPLRGKPGAARLLSAHFSSLDFTPT